jgi:Leucine-rich repeat (LRR) protein
LDISDEELEGKLSLVGFNELKYLICCGNKLTEIDLRGCKKLSTIDCRENKLSNLMFNENFELEIKEF